MVFASASRWSNSYQGVTLHCQRKRLLHVFRKTADHEIFRHYISRNNLPFLDSTVTVNS